jgi:hypothetical protein
LLIDAESVVYDSELSEEEDDKMVMPSLLASEDDRVSCLFL